MSASVLFVLLDVRRTRRGALVRGWSATVYTSAAAAAAGEEQANATQAVRQTPGRRVVAVEVLLDDGELEAVEQATRPPPVEEVDREPEPPEGDEDLAERRHEAWLLGP